MRIVKDERLSFTAHPNRQELLLGNEKGKSVNPDSAGRKLQRATWINYPERNLGFYLLSFWIIPSSPQVSEISRN